MNDPEPDDDAQGTEGCGDDLREVRVAPRLWWQAPEQHALI